MRQRDVRGASISSFEDVSIGVAQGSILGPLLFIVYINDLPIVIKECDVSIYADDTAIYTSKSSIMEVESSLQEDLDSISTWMSCNKLKLNIKKTASMLIGSIPNVRNKIINLTIENEPVQYVTSKKLLAGTIESSLTWDVHCRNVL